MLKTMSTEETRRMMLAVCDRIIAEKPCLTQLDSPIGDADHGIGMSRGMMAARKKLKEKACFSDINQIFKVTGRSMLSTMGGSSGVVFGTLFSGAVKDMVPEENLTADLFCRMMENGLAQVQKRGKAQPGDKTMVDALAPSVTAMKKRVGESEDLVGLFFLAADQARQGAEATRDKIARHGHSKSLGKRALGHPDPGAVSVYFIFDAMYQAGRKIEEEKAENGIKDSQIENGR